MYESLDLVHISMQLLNTYLILIIDTCFIIKTNSTAQLSAIGMSYDGTDLPHVF